MIKLIKCPYCGRIYKIVKEDRHFHTDLGGVLHKKKDSCQCMHCKKLFPTIENSMNTEDWIANLLFKIKG